MTHGRKILVFSALASRGSARKWTPLYFLYLRRFHFCGVDSLRDLKHCCCVFFVQHFVRKSPPRNAEYIYFRHRGFIVRTLYVYILYIFFSDGSAVFRKRTSVALRRKLHISSRVRALSKNQIFIRIHFSLYYITIVRVRTMLFLFFFTSNYLSIMYCM